MTHGTAQVEARHTNRLALEKSPYLLQHQYNPVDWHSWGEEAFAKARRENKPVFLSIGYSTCHWCHVMERESFENEQIAQFLNEHFVSIKVDREERPDVDKIYMTFVQAMTGSGGWPLNVFITPERKPFFGGTYWPPESRQGRPGFPQILQGVANAWAAKSAEVLASADHLTAQLEQLTARGGEQAVLGTQTLHQAGAVLKQGYDAVNGGFGHAPKFPSPSYLRFLLRYGKRFGDQEAIQMILHTCDKMAEGGIHDQIGGGFSRYSVDAQWLVPHFEKMLYDNAQLVQLYLDACVLSGKNTSPLTPLPRAERGTGNPRYADVVRDVLTYVLRDMTHPEGGFYSAEDADSEGKEGKFYCWTEAELKALLNREEFDLVTNYFGVTAEGNFVDHSDPNPLPHQNVLGIANPRAAEGREPVLESARRKMFEARNKRVRPHLDDKVLASWNGLMLGAMARAGAVLGEKRYLMAAEKNAAFVRGKLWDAETRTLYHRWRDGQRDSVELLEGYAFFLDGVLDLYEATLDPKHLDFAAALAETMLERFHDSEEGGFFQSTNPDLILKVKDDYDGAEPSGNAVATLALLRLAAITDRPEFKRAGESTLRLFSDRLQQLPQAVPFLLAALDFSVDEPRRVVIAGAADGMADLLRGAHSVFQPNKVVLGNTGPVEPFARSLKPVNGQATAYLCLGTACQAPTHDPKKLGEMLATGK